MAIITVTRQDAIDILRENIYLDEHYSFKEISTILKNNFEGINNSQISGLIHRLSTGKSPYLSKFFMDDNPNMTKYCINKEWTNQENMIHNAELTKDELIVLTNEVLEKSIVQLNNLKTKINKTEDFIWLQHKIDGIEVILRNNQK